MTTLYRPILKQAWKVTWKYKFVWLFGFIVALWGNGGALEIILTAPDKLTFQRDFWLTLQTALATGTLINFLQSLPVILQTASSDWWMIVSLISGLLLVLAIFWLSAVATGAMVVTAANVGKRRAVTLPTTWQKGRKHWARVLTVIILAKLAIGALAFILGGYLLWLVPRSTAIGVLFALLTSLVMLAMSLIVYFLSLYAINSVVLENTGIKTAIIRGWEVFRRAPIISLEMSVVLLGITMMFFLIFSLFGSLIARPLVELVNVFVYINLLPLFYIFLGLLALTLIIGFLAVVSWFGAFQITCWTLIYQQISKGTAVSKLTRLVHGVPKSK